MNEVPELANSRDELDRDLRAGFRELARQSDPILCTCYSTSDDNGVIFPVLCQQHRDEHRKQLGPFHWVSVKYQRYFASEEDAKDRARIIRDRWPSAGYGTTVSIIPISRWWLVRADWSDSCE